LLEGWRRQPRDLTDWHIGNQSWWLLVCFASLRLPSAAVLVVEVHLLGVGVFLRPLYVVFLSLPEPLPEEPVDLPLLSYGFPPSPFLAEPSQLLPSV